MAQRIISLSHYFCLNFHLHIILMRKEEMIKWIKSFI
nr:MAG TPA: hypothetical protein [Caudoviricetes sp.]